MGQFTIYDATGNATFSGADMLASITVPMLTNDPVNGGKIVVSRPVTVGNIQTLSVSVHRQKAPVPALGRINAKGFTRGFRTVAGTLVFAIFDTEALAEVQAQVRSFYQSANLQYNAHYGNQSVQNLIPNFKADELPPFDITVTGANELGNAISYKITGVEVVTEGMVTGVNELYLENAMQYLAQDFAPIYPLMNTITSQPYAEFA